MEAKTFVHLLYMFFVVIILVTEVVFHLYIFSSEVQVTMNTNI